MKKISDLHNFYDTLKKKGLRYSYLGKTKSLFCLMILIYIISMWRTMVMRTIRTSTMTTILCFSCSSLPITSSTSLCSTTWAATACLSSCTCARCTVWCSCHLSGSTACTTSPTRSRRTRPHICTTFWVMSLAKQPCTTLDITARPTFCSPSYICKFTTRLAEQTIWSNSRSTWITQVSVCILRWQNLLLRIWYRFLIQVSPCREPLQEVQVTVLFPLQVLQFTVLFPLQLVQVGYE